MNTTLLLLHGIWMQPLELALLKKRLQEHGYAVHAPAYHSMSEPPVVNAAYLHQLVSQWNIDRLHIVGHSLGGIVALHLLTRYNDLPMGRIVTLGSPVTGSQIARRVTKVPVLRRIFGRSMENGLSGDGLPNHVPREWGMIAGNSPIGLGWLAGGFREGSDGAVALSETLHPGIKERLVLPFSHTGMLFSRQVADQTHYFLENGVFAARQ